MGNLAYVYIIKTGYYDVHILLVIAAVIVITRLFAPAECSFLTVEIRVQKS